MIHTMWIDVNLRVRQERACSEDCPKKTRGLSADYADVRRWRRASVPIPICANLRHLRIQNHELSWTSEAQGSGTESWHEVPC